MRHLSPYACPLCLARMTYEDLKDEALGCDPCGLRAKLVLGSRALCEPAGEEAFLVDLHRM